MFTTCPFGKSSHHSPRYSVPMERVVSLDFGIAMIVCVDRASKQKITPNALFTAKL